MKKRLLALMIVLALSLSLIPSTVFAAEEAQSPYAGKIISVMGDSITTFEGVSFSTRDRYPGNAEGSGVDTVNDTWWMQVINDLGAELGACDARGSSTVTNIYDKVTADGRKGPGIAMASWERINNLGANGDPDVILFYGGTNDKNAVYRDSLYTMGTFDPETAPSLEDYDPETDTAIKWANVVEGFVAAILRIKATYPDAELIALLPRNGSADNFNKDIKPIFDHYEVPTISLEDVPKIGIWDTLHPNAYGMDYITEKVKAYMTGEEFQYPMYHEAPVQDIPEGAYSDTNLWTELTVNNGYYKSKIWNTTYPSITIPVTEGDQVYASSFQANTITGGSSSGIAVSYLKDGKIVKSLGPEDVYAEFQADGCVTVPADVDAINVPMWKSIAEADRVVNLLSLPENPDAPADEPEGDDPSAEEPGEIPGEEIDPPAEEPKNDHLWEVPAEGIYNTTNLWPLANAAGKVAQGYYKSTGWTSHASHFSITIPVEPGERIFSSAFQARAINGNTSTSDGILLTWLYGNTMSRHVAAGDIFAEFDENGYITVPDDIEVNAVNLVTWNTASNSPVVLLLDRPDDPAVDADGSPEETPVEQLPADACSDTNLWQYYKDAGKLVSGGYYSGAGAWTTGSYKTVTVAVEPGDHFTTGALAGDGLVVSFWKGDHFVIGYSKANANKAHDVNGYLTVPGGVNAVNIILSNSQSSSAANGYFKILTLPEGITSAELTVAAPVAGEAPQTTLSGETYTGTITWSPAAETVFAPDTEYTAEVTLTAKDGYKFKDGFTATVNGEAVTFTRSADGTTATGSLSFEATAPGEIAEAELIVAAPVTGAAPQTTLEGNGFTGTVTWSPEVEDVFAPNNVYTANITLTAAEGLGFASDFAATVNGEAVTFEVNAEGTAATGSVTFPITTLEVITAVELTVTAPAAGEVPQTTLAGEGYTGTITWSPEVDGKFAAETVYTANIMLTPENGYVFAGELTATINGAAAELTLLEDAATGSITFPETVEPIMSADHLQWLPEGVEAYADTNLWTLLSPKKEYHTGTAWRYTHATVYSVTIPVKPGDRIYANSFQSSSVNEGTSHGIVVAYFYGDKLVKSLGSGSGEGTTYAEYLANGYITVPEGVNAVCIPVWKNNENAVVNLLTLPKRITSAELTVTAPVANKAPQTALEGNGFTGTVTWSPEVDGKFAFNTTYTAEITLTAEAGNKIMPEFAATVNGEAVTFEVNAEGTAATGSVTFAKTQTQLDGHLQAIPEGTYADDNLWEKLTPEKRYFTSTGWDSDYYSITFPVQEGDRVYASSFRDKSQNGSPSGRNGIVIGYFYEDGSAKMISYTEVYAEYVANGGDNGGYLVMPENVVAVCIPMWKNNADSVVNLLTLPKRVGDLDNEVGVGLGDFTVLARYLAGWDGYEEQVVSTEIADINKDSKISAADAMILARYLAGWSGFDTYFK